MDFRFTEEQDAFRQDVRDFAAAELEAGAFEVSSKGLVAAKSIPFSKKMADRGWIGFTWPESYGGKNGGYVNKMIMLEELFRVQAPIGYHFLADRQVGPAIMKFGNDWQKSKFLPGIISADEGMMFCLLFSEPGAGSDLAGVTTRAEKDGDDYIINGQKVWTSEAHIADYGWMLARTDFDPALPGHRACSEFIIDMASPGITIRPIINMAGDHSFNEVFFDDVRIHKKHLVGTENAGFKQIMAQMDYERSGIERIMQNYPIYDRLLRYVLSMDEVDRTGEFYHWVRDSMAQLEIDFNGAKLLCYQVAWSIDQGTIPTSQAALCKAFCTQCEQRLNDVAMRIFGPASRIRDDVSWRPIDLDVTGCYLWAPSYTLQGGSVEVLKNIVAQRGLGLPRG